MQRQIQQHLGHVVGLSRTTGDVHDRQARLRLPAPAEVVGHPHRPGRVVLHRRDAAVGGAGADRDDRRRLRGEPVEPLARRDRLAGLRIVADRREVALAGEVLVRDRALDAEHERVELAALGLPPVLDELGTVLVGEHRVVDDHLRHPRDRLGDDVLEARVDRRRHRDGVAVARQSRRHPDHVRLDRLGLVLVRHELGCRGCRHRQLSFPERR